MAQLYVYCIEHCFLSDIQTENHCTDWIECSCRLKLWLLILPNSAQGDPLKDKNYKIWTYVQMRYPPGRDGPIIGIIRIGIGISVFCRESVSL